MSYIIGLNGEMCYALEEKEEIEEAISRYANTGTCGKTRKYCKDFVTFDIETTSMEDYGFMYIAMFCIGDDVIFVRRWEEVLEVFNLMIDVMQITLKKRLVVYVHALFFEFQFIRNFLKWDDIFATDIREVIKATSSSGLEFRCSYRLTNMSLDKFCQKTKGVVHGKAVGKLDYSIIRTCETVLNNDERYYAYCDVKGLHEGLETLLQEDDLSTIPMTSTGYVRRECKEAVRSNEMNIEMLKTCEFDKYFYLFLRTLSRGGDCSVNYLLANKIIENVDSWDISSSYPFVMMVKKYPYGKWVSDSCEHICDDRCYIMRVKFTNIRVKKCKMIGYIPRSKCKIVGKFVNANGRVLKAEAVTMLITNVDLEIIKSRYDIEEIEIIEGYSASADYLPKELREVIMRYFYLKTELKHKDKYLYNKSKNKLNAIFGMMLTDVCNSTIELRDCGWYECECDIDKELKKYFTGANCFLNYAWGVFITAYARQRLNEPYLANVDFAIYNDTDSWKLMEGYSRRVFEEINRKVKLEADSYDIKPYIELDGVRTYLGVWEYEGTYDKFKTLGAKKYCTEKSSEIEVTVSGLSKEKGSEYLKKLGGIEYFNEGRVFDEKVSGRTYALYDDCNDIKKITVDGVTFTTSSSVSVHNTTYTLGVGKEYGGMLDIINKYGISKILG